MTYGGTSSVGRRDTVEKGLLQQSVVRPLARRAPAAGRNGRRVVTGDAENARRVVGKSYGKPNPGFSGRKFADLAYKTTNPEVKARATAGAQRHQAGIKSMQNRPRGYVQDRAGLTADVRRYDWDAQQAGKGRKALTRFKAGQPSSPPRRGFGDYSNFGKADVEKGVLDSLRGGLSAFKTGAKGGFGRQTNMTSPAAKPLRQAQFGGQKVGQFGAHLSARRGLYAGGTLGTAGLGTGLALGGDKQQVSVGKRRYDPEDERRHRQGLQAGLMGAGGAGLAVQGGRNVVRDTRALRGSIRGLPTIADEPKAPKQYTPRRTNTRGNPRKATPDEILGDKQTHAHEMDQWHSRQKARKKIEQAKKTPIKGAVVRGRAALQIGGGVGLLAGAAAHHTRRRDSRWD